MFIDLWIDYIQFVYEYCRNERLAKTIFQTASKHINPNLCYKLAYKFNKLQNHYMYVLRIVFFNHEIKSNFFFFIGIIHVFHLKMTDFQN